MSAISLDRVARYLSRVSLADAQLLKLSLKRLQASVLFLRGARARLTKGSLNDGWIDPSCAD